MQRFHEEQSLAWGPPQFQEKRSRSEKAILGALGEFRGILGAALGIGNSILGMASHDLINTKPTILGATLGAIPGIAANPPERFSFAPAFSERFFKNWGGPRAPEEQSARSKGARLSPLGPAPYLTVVGRCCRLTAPDLTVKTELKDRIAKSLVSQDLPSGPFQTI